jgi:hypothetical protein
VLGTDGKGTGPRNRVNRMAESTYVTEQAESYGKLMKNRLIPYSAKRIEEEHRRDRLCNFLFKGTVSRDD